MEGLDGIVSRRNFRRECVVNYVTDFDAAELGKQAKTVIGGE